MIINVHKGNIYNNYVTNHFVDIDKCILNFFSQLKERRIATTILKKNEPTPFKDLLYKHRNQNCVVLVEE